MNCVRSQPFLDYEREGEKAAVQEPMPAQRPTETLTKKKSVVSVKTAVGKLKQQQKKKKKKVMKLGGETLANPLR